MSTQPKRQEIVIPLTDEQSDALVPLLRVLTLHPGSAIIAQVYGDGMRVTTLTPDQCQAVATALGGDLSREHNSAFAAHLDRVGAAA